MLEQDVVLSKMNIIKNCLNTIHRVTDSNSEKLDDMIIQDVFVLNLQRAVQAAIDMAHVLISAHGWKLPANYGQAFTILRENGVITGNISDTMIRMTGFRNIAVHNYQELNTDILKSIQKRHLEDFEKYYSAVFAWMNKE